MSRSSAEQILLPLKLSILLWAITFWECGRSTLFFYWFVLGSLRLLGESCLKVMKASLDQYHYHWNVQFYWLCTKTQVCEIKIWEGGCSTWWILFIWVFFIVGIGESCFETPKVLNLLSRILNWRHYARCCLISF